MVMRVARKPETFFEEIKHSAVADTIERSAKGLS
jgi:hypothetical protein